MRQPVARVGMLAFSLIVAGAAGAAPPVVPATVSYQGVLLDGAGNPQTGNVDLTLRVYDSLSGGTLLYKQVFTAVPLTDGVFSIQLGPTGLATDTPTNPLTTSLQSALAGDLAATGPSRFLEITVGAAGPLARTQLLAVPYAMDAAHAASADSAAEAGSVSGVPDGALSEIFAHVNFDGGPPNDDPLEGLGDVDGDSIANFVDADNDDDSLSDTDEVAGGSGVNLVTPVITGTLPPTVLWSGGSLAVSGLNFEPGLAVSLDAQSPAPQNLTGTSFDVALAPEPKGTHTLAVTRLNGETDSAPVVFEADQAHGLTWSTGRLLSLAMRGQKQIAMAVVPGGGRIDTNADGTLDLNLAFQLGGAPAGPLAFSPAGRLAALDSGFTVFFYLDTSGNYVFSVPERVQVEGGGSAESGETRSEGIGFDPAGGRVAAYLRSLDSVHHAKVAHDLNNDGSFAGANELVTIEPILDPAFDLGALAVDASGHVAYAYYDQGADLLRLAWDRSGDGDYTDTVSGNPELATLAATPALACIGLAFDGAGVLGAVYAPTGSAPVLARDFNGDGDFGDAGEAVTLGSSAASGCDVAAGGGPGISVAHDGGGGLTLLVDRNGDDDFDDADESRALGLASAGPYAPIAVAQGSTGLSVVATRTDVFQDVP